MKSISADDFGSNISRYLLEVQQESIVITQGGKPCAVVHGVPDDLETAELEHSAEFWRMIEKRRQEPSIAWAEAKAKLGLS